MDSFVDGLQMRYDLPGKDFDHLQTLTTKTPT
jgi:hypothetical protein